MDYNINIFDGLFDGVIIIDESFRIVYANPFAKKILGGDKVEGSHCHGSFSICNSCPFDHVKKKGVQVYNVEASGSCKLVCWSMSPYYEGGRFKGVIEVFRDVSKIVNCITETQSQRIHKENILDFIVEAILVLDEKGKVREHNHVAKKVLCREEREDLIGRNIKELINLSLEELPPEGERSEVYIDTPCGKQKASILVSPMSQVFGYVLSLYVTSDIHPVNFNDLEIISTKSPAFKKTLDLAISAANYDVNILIEGETGTGKSLLAKYIHRLSHRRDRPFIKVNCAAIPDTLLEAELFGYAKGAFTGAVKDKPGKVELAEGGTLFLDEIGDMPLHLQAKILHLIQEKEFERLGDTKTRKVNIRFIAATNKNLKKLIKSGSFREDLYYRLGVVRLYLPPLRERKEDIPSLVSYFIEKFSKKYSRKIKGISADAMRVLLGYNFPGNVRELENIIECAVITCRGGLIQSQDLQIEPETVSISLDEIEKIKRTLKEVDGNKSLAAKILGIHRTTLWRKLKEIGYKD